MSVLKNVYISSEDMMVDLDARESHRDERSGKKESRDDGDYAHSNCLSLRLIGQKCHLF